MKPDDVFASGASAELALAPQAISQDVLREKYAKTGETRVDQVRRRVARALAAAEAPQLRERWERAFYDAQVEGFIPAGRINSAAGTNLKATLIHCFVQPIDDCISGTGDCIGIYDALQQAAETLRRRGAVGYDFSRIRPRHALVRGTGSHASGPVSYMQVFDTSCQTVDSAGARRGAQMAVLRIDHPDIAEFIHAKRNGGLTHFNLCVALTDAFLEAVRSGGEWELVHRAQPGSEIVNTGAYRRGDGLWVYRKARADELWQQIMRSTYEHAEPGVLFIDTINRDNNLRYCEKMEAANPCGQMLPPYGCCDLGSINLTEFVDSPFTERAGIDFRRLGKVVCVAVRMLDNVLDTTVWPLAQQAREARAKRRVGLGFTGLGDALIMLGLRYDCDEGREMAASIAQRLRNVAYLASVHLARQKSAFPLFDAEQYLAAPSFASRLPEYLKRLIRTHGIRNSHLLAIAPTGTISLAFANNASNGIEPAYAGRYTRKKRRADHSIEDYVVEDPTCRRYRHLHGLGEDVTLLPFDPSGGRHAGEVWTDAKGARFSMLPPYFVSVLQISALDHVRMSSAVQPFVDSTISKPVNVAQDYPFDAFKDLYLQAWQAGLKGMTTYRPGRVTGTVLEVPEAPMSPLQDLDLSDPDRRIKLDAAPRPPLASLRWPGRPVLPDGNPCWTYAVRHPLGNFAVFIGHIDNGAPCPFEVWVNGAEQPRGLGAVAKTLSMDMRADDRGWLDLKLCALEKASGDDAFEISMPPDARRLRVPSLVAGFARLVRYRCDALGAFSARGAQTPVLDALIGRKEPKAGVHGTMSWTVDVFNPATGDDFAFFLKELVMPDGQRRPYSMWLAGEFPRVLDGLCKLLSLDMRVMDAAWIGMKLRKLLNYGEPNGAFMARIPGSEKSQRWPSTIAYLARLTIHRYAMLGLLTEQGYPVCDAGILAVPAGRLQLATAPTVAGKCCPQCANAALIRKDGCEFCTACGHIGACG